MLQILVKPKNSIIKQYIRLFELDGVELNVSKDALEVIVDHAIDLGLGARGLRSLCEVIFRNYMFNIDNYKGELNITKDEIENEVKVLDFALLNK